MIDQPPQRSNRIHCKGPCKRSLALGNGKPEGVMDEGGALRENKQDFLAVGK